MTVNGAHSGRHSELEIERQLTSTIGRKRWRIALIQAVQYPFFALLGMTMPKGNKPRHSAKLDSEAAQDWLASWAVDPDDIREAAFFSDGSLSILTSKFHVGIEFNVPLAQTVAGYLQSVGVNVSHE